MLLLPWLFAIGFAVADEIVVARLLRFQYLNFRSWWDEDGKPSGVVWAPEEATLGGWFVRHASGHAAQLARWRWLFGSPEWVSHAPNGRVLMRLHRVFLLAFLACVPAPFVIAALLQSHFG